MKNPGHHRQTDSNRPDNPFVIQYGIQRQVVRLRLKIRQKIGPKTQADRKRTGRQSRQCAIVKTTPVTQPVTTRGIPHTRDKKKRWCDHLRVLGFWNAVSVFFHGAAWVPGMELHGFGDFIDHRQANLAPLGLVHEFAIFLPAMQRWKWVKFTLDWPIGSDDRVWSTNEPNTHDLLQALNSLQTVW